MEIQPVIIGALITASVAATIPPLIPLVQHSFSRRYKYLERNMKLLKEGGEEPNFLLSEVVKRQKNFFVIKEMERHQRAKYKLKNRISYGGRFFISAINAFMVFGGFTSIYNKIVKRDLSLMEYFVPFCLGIMFSIIVDQFMHRNAEISLYYTYFLEGGKYDKTEGTLPLTLFYSSSGLLGVIRRTNYELDYEYLVFYDDDDDGFYVYAKEKSEGYISYETNGNSGLSTSYTFLEKGQKGTSLAGDDYIPRKNYRHSKVTKFI